MPNALRFALFPHFPGLAVCLLTALVSLPACSRRVEEIRATDRESIESQPDAQASPEDWPWWRGPQADGHANGPVPPLRWSETENVVWKADIEGRGHASPSIRAGRVYVATADETAETMSLIAVDQKSGERLWSRELHRGQFMHTHRKNSHASATPACDGQHVYCVNMLDGGVWASAVDLSGDVVWQTKAGGFRSKHGYGSSPVLYKSLVIVQGDSSGGGFLAALSSQSGEIVWRVARKNSASFATPALADFDGEAHLLLSGQGELVSYDPANGDVRWRAAGPATTTANTVVWDKQRVYASGGYPEKRIMAVNLDGEHETAWQVRRKLYVPSMLIVEEHLIVLQDDGIARCLSVDDGAEVWSKRLGGGFSLFPIQVQGYTLATNEQGKTFVFKAVPQYELVATNQLGTAGFASPVVCQGRLYLRTENAIYCIGHPTPADEDPAGSGTGDSGTGESSAGESSAGISRDGSSGQRVSG